MVLISNRLMVNGCSKTCIHENLTIGTCEELCHNFGEIMMINPLST